jgi:hypothetical protein
MKVQVRISKLCQQTSITWNDGQIMFLEKKVHFFSASKDGLKGDWCLDRVVSQCYQQFFGIGILPVSGLTGQSVFRSVLLVWRELLFSAKGGLAVSKRGLLFVQISHLHY